MDKMKSISIGVWNNPVTLKAEKLEVVQDDGAFFLKKDDYKCPIHEGATRISDFCPQFLPNFRKALELLGE